MTRSADPAREEGWEAHRMAEPEGRLRSTPSQRLRWLEEAIEFAWLAGALPRKDGVKTRLLGGISRFFAGSLTLILASFLGLIGFTRNSS